MSFSPSHFAMTAIHQMLKALDGILDKASAHAQETGVEEAVYLNWRLTPDMFPMVRQVQIATELPARGMARLAGAELPSFPDTETSFAALKARVNNIRAFIDAIDITAIDKDPEDMLTFPAGGGEMQMQRKAYLTDFILPNLYFHTSTAYGLLRSAGVPLGKRDFLAL
ncbi:MAG: DUF1993 domain-containing protein [Pseudomonadota bacterium]